MTLLLITQILYALTIPAAGYVALRDPANLQKMLTILAYIVLAGLYIFNVQYHAAFGYAAWGLVNASLFCLLLRK